MTKRIVINYIDDTQTRHSECIEDAVSELERSIAMGSPLKFTSDNGTFIVNTPSVKFVEVYDE